MKKGLKTLIVGILLFIIGAFIVPLAIILPIMLGASDGRQFIIPGTIEVEVVEPGHYYLWNDFKTVYDGTSYNRSDSIPDGLEINVTDQGGEMLSFIGDTSVSSSSGSSSKNSIGYVEVINPGQLTVAVLGSSDERVFSFSQSRIMMMLGLIFGGIGLSMLLAVTGVGISILGIVKIVKNNRV